MTLTEQSLPAELLERFKAEEAEETRRLKERAEAHLFMTVDVVADASVLSFDAYSEKPACDFVDFRRDAMQLRVRKASVAACETIGKEKSEADEKAAAVRQAREESAAEWGQERLALHKEDEAERGRAAERARQERQAAKARRAVDMLTKHGAAARAAVAGCGSSVGRSLSGGSSGRASSR